MQTDEEIEEIDMQVYKEKVRETDLASDPTISNQEPGEEEIPDDTLTPPDTQEPTDDTTIQEPDNGEEPEEA
jgi:hypothetical protein